MPHAGPSPERPSSSSGVRRRRCRTIRPGPRPDSSERRHPFGHRRFLIGQHPTRPRPKRRRRRSSAHVSLVAPGQNLGGRDRLLLRPFTAKRRAERGMLAHIGDPRHTGDRRRAPTDHQILTRLYLRQQR